MKLAETFFSAAALFLVGCQTARRPRPVAHVPLPVVSPPAPTPTGVRIPEVIKTYTLGAYADPEDPTVRHAAHVIHRIEGATTWNLAPVIAEPPLAPDRVPSVPPPPLTPPVVTLEVISAPALAVAALSTAIPTVTAPAAPPQPPPAPALIVDPTPVILPNADGLIDLTALDAAKTSDDLNPFAVRTSSGSATRELTLLVSGVVGGDRPSALVNQRPIEVGDRVESLTLERVETDAAVFRNGDRLLRLPVAASAIRIRLAL